MGLLEEPRYVLKNVVNKFHEMPENTIREQTFCCGSGTGLNTDEFMETRMKGGLPRANAAKYAMEKHDVNRLPIVSKGKLVGIIARADLIKALVD